MTEEAYIRLYLEIVKSNSDQWESGLERGVARTIKMSSPAILTLIAVILLTPGISASASQVYMSQDR